MFHVDFPIARIQALATDEAFTAAMDQLYAALDGRIAARGPTCINRGLCCRFDSFGHQLFVTSAELAYFVARLNGGPQPPSSGTCPFQIGGVCTVRSARPAGCRIFFCEAVSQGWQPDETEAALVELRRLHERFDLPYAYGEWLEALRQLSETPETRDAGAFDNPAAAFYDGGRSLNSEQSPRRP